LIFRRAKAILTRFSRRTIKNCVGDDLTWPV
jgi:hypothetical protein